MKTNTCRQIKTVEELVLLQERGVLVMSPSVTWMEKPRKIDAILKLSVDSLLKMLSKGVYAVGEEESAPEDSVLINGRAKIRATGLSQTEIAVLVGVTKQAVSQFMSAASVQTRILDKYLNALGIK